MADSLYTFRIEGFTPDTIPMGRLAEYMAAFADLLGSEPHTHFAGLKEGSARLVSRVEERETVRVAKRLGSAGTGGSAVDKAYAVIDDMLANDNTQGQVYDPEGGVIIAFPGATRPRPISYPAFRQNGSIDGEVVKIGGKDKTAHVMLQDGDLTYSNITVSREIAKTLGPYLYGQKVRLFGSGRWERHPDGSWKLLDFKVDRFDPLDEAPLDEVLHDLRRAAGDLGGTLYNEVLGLRTGGDGKH